MHYDIFLSAPTFYWYSLVFIFSLCVGSFLNVVIYRIPKIMDRTWQNDCQDYLKEQGFTIQPPANYQPIPDNFNLAIPASSCPKCQHQIRWYENIPLFSYLILLRGRCSCCKTPISPRYPTIELLTACLSTACVIAFGFTWMSAAAIVLTWLLISLSWIDIDHKIIPDEFNYIILWLGLLFNAMPYLNVKIATFTTLPNAILGAVVGYLSLWSVYKLFKLLTGKEGMGYGDFKLLAALGAWVGINNLLVVILLSSVAGAIIGSLVILINKKGRDFQIPFGPYLAIAGWITLLFGSTLVQWYLSVIL